MILSCERQCDTLNLARDSPPSIREDLLHTKQFKELSYGELPFGIGKIPSGEAF